MKKIAVFLSFITLILSSVLLLPSAIVQADSSDGRITENPLYVWLIAGQSNAAGYTSWTGYTGDRRFTDVLYYGVTDNQALSTARVTDVHIGLGTNETKIGPEIGMASIITGNNEGKEYAFIKCAYGSSSLSPSAISSDTTSNSYRYGSWTSPSYLDKHPTTNSRAGLAYENMLSVVEAGLGAYQALGYTPIVSGIAWMQGEKDALSNIAAAEYKELLLDFVSDLQSNIKEIGEKLSLPQPNCFPLVTALIPKSYGLGNAQKIREGMMGAAEESEWISTIDNDNLIIGSDGHHYTVDSMVQLGKNFGTALLSVQTEENSFASINYDRNLSGNIRTLEGDAGNKVKIELRVTDGYDFEVAFAMPDGSTVDGEVVEFTKEQNSFSFVLPQGSILVSVTAVAIEQQPGPGSEEPGEQQPVTPTPGDQSPSNGLPIGVIIAIIAATVIVVAVVAFIIVRCHKKKKQNK